jgi:probable F420-dependent oxidoreductase
MFTDTTRIAITKLATLVEERGFDSLHVAQHTHLPLTQGLPIDDLPAESAPAIARLCDPFVLLSCAAAVTTRIRLGTSVCLAAEYEPIGLAHLVATLDHVSGGRVELGVGYGSNRAEMENRGLDWRNRRAILRENVLAMQAIWSNDVAKFDGEFVQFGDIWSWPKPVQNPLPVYLGAVKPSAFGDLVEFCNGWLPMTLVMSDDDLRDGLAALQRTAAEAGRDPATIELSMMVGREGNLAAGAMGEPATLDQYRETCLRRVDIDKYISLVASSSSFPVGSVITRVPLTNPDLVEPMLDLLAKQVFG